jgi:hypothetical protein
MCCGPALELGCFRFREKNPNKLGLRFFFFSGCGSGDSQTVNR